MNRYRATGLAYHPLVPDPEGEWVRYEEVHRIVAECISQHIDQHLANVQGNDPIIASAIGMSAIEKAEQAGIGGPKGRA